MKKLLLIALVLALLTPALAIDKHGLLTIGGRVFYWLPQGDFGNAYTGSMGFGAKVGYGLSSNMEIFGEAWYGMAGFDEDFWGDQFEGDGKNYYLVTFVAGGRLNLSPYSPFDPYIQVGAGYYNWAYTEVDDDAGTYTYGEASDQKFGINVRGGGEFFTSNQMSVDVGVEWNSIFGVTVPIKDWNDPDDHSQGWEWNEENQTVNILAFGIGVNLYF